MAIVRIPRSYTCANFDQNLWNRLCENSSFVFFFLSPNFNCRDAAETYPQHELNENRCTRLCYRVLQIRQATDIILKITFLLRAPQNHIYPQKTHHQYFDLLYNFSGSI